MKKYIVAILLILGGFTCFFTYMLIGSYIDEGGVLVEPFFLIPLGYVLLLSGLIILVVLVLIRCKIKKRV